MLHVNDVRNEISVMVCAFARHYFVRAILLFLIAIPTFAYPAARFTADDQNLRVPHQSIIDLGLPVQNEFVYPGDKPFLHNTDFTIEAWIKPSAATRNQSFKFIVSKNFGGTGYALVMIGKDHDQRFHFESDSLVSYGFQDGFNERAFRNQWFHIAGVRRGDKLFIFINGMFAAEASKPGPARPNDRPLWIGSSPWGSFRGDIAEVRLWRTARTHPEIVYFMNQKLSGHEDSLAAYYPLDTDFRNQTYRETLRQTSLDASPSQNPPKFVASPPLSPSNATVAARSPKINIEIDGKLIDFRPGTEPFIMNGRAYAAVCTISEKINFVLVRSNSVRHLIKLESPAMSNRIKGAPPTVEGLIPIGALSSTINGKSVDLPAPAIVINRSTPQKPQLENYYPLTFITQILGHKTQWIESTKTVQIQTMSKTPQ